MQGGYGRVPGMGKKQALHCWCWDLCPPSTKGWQGLAGGTGRWITQSSTISKNSFSISHIMPSKSFPVSRVFTDPRQQHPELCRPFSPRSWSEQQQLKTTGSSWEPRPG